MAVYFQESLIFFQQTVEMKTPVQVLLQELGIWEILFLTLCLHDS